MKRISNIILNSLLKRNKSIIKVWEEEIFLCEYILLL